MLNSRLMPNSVFYAETTFAGDDMQDSNWLSAAIHRALGITAASSTASDAWCSTQDDLPRPGDLSYFVGAWHMNQAQDDELLIRCDCWWMLTDYSRICRCYGYSV